ncbi:MAG: alpha/beta hydrolase [Halioglobus sp.]
MTAKKPGYHQFNTNETLNFMLNRLSWDIEEERLREIGQNVSTLDNFVEKMLLEARLAEDENRYLQAGFFYRGAEFFMSEDHPDKALAYDKFMEYFYQETHGASEQHSLVDFAGGKLGVIDIPAEGDEKGTLLFCSGFDGLIEELYGIGLSFAAAGYRVVLFEGTGQGSALRRYHLPMTHDWEKPVAAVLDALAIESCTLIGMSLGGYLAPRAAAFEPRVKQLVAWGAMQDFTAALKASRGKVVGGLMFKLVDMGCKKTINRLAARMMATDETAKWSINHGMHTSGQTTPFGFLKWMLDFNLNDTAQQIEQDAIIIMGENDHLVPVEQMRIQADAMINAKSVTTRLVTAKEHGAQHCQIGNPDLVIDEILRWMDGLVRRDLRIAS